MCRVCPNYIRGYGGGIVGIRQSIDGNNFLPHVRQHIRAAVACCNRFTGEVEIVSAAS
jgi:hypothetical protein